MGQTLKTTAYHEAAHAIIAWYHRRTVLNLSIKPKQKTLGRLTSFHLYQFPETSIHDIEIDLDIILAGKAAENILLEYEDETLGWYLDLFKAFDAAEVLCAKKKAYKKIRRISSYRQHIRNGNSLHLIFYGGAFFDDFGQHVKELLERDHIWVCVDHVAKILLEQQELDEQELGTIISDIWALEKVNEKEEMIGIDRIKKQLGREWGVWGDELLKVS
jgi:ATP-dependent Zn protease